MNFFRRFHGRPFAARLSLLLFAILAQGCASDPSWRVETALDIVYDRLEPAVRKVERNVHFYSHGQAGLPVRHLLIETDVRTSFRWGEKGADGTVSVKARRYQDKTPEGDVLYAFESEGVGVSIEGNFIIVVATEETARPIHRYYDARTGEFLFESYGAAARMSFLSKSTFWTPMAAGFSPLSHRASSAHSGQNRVIGVLAYIPHESILSEALLMADDVEKARHLSSYVDEQHRLIWIDQRTGKQPDPILADKNVDLNDVVLRLNFRESSMDLDFPVTPDGFDYARVRLPKGLSLVPIERTR